jgi:hypothetical protein
MSHLCGFLWSITGIALPFIITYVRHVKESIFTSNSIIIDINVMHVWCLFSERKSPMSVKTCQKVGEKVKCYHFLFSWAGVRLSPLGMSVTNWPIVPALHDRWWVWSSWWNENGQGKLKYLEKTCPSATLSTTNPHDLTQARTRAAVVGRQRLTAWSMARL